MNQLDISMRVRLALADFERNLSQLNANFSQAMGRVTGGARNAGDAIEQAFDVIGVRSTATIRAEIAQIEAAFQTLSTSSGVSGEDLSRAFEAGRARVTELLNELGELNNGLHNVSQGAARAGGGIASALAPLAAAMAGMAGGKEFIDANISLEALQRTLVKMTGSSEAARAEVEWLKKSANTLGLEAQGASRAWIGIAAAAKDTAMEGQKSRDVFLAVSGAMASLGKTAADTEGALMAISQMMSKGVVSQEEMRQQLGERLPGAMQATAAALGMTVQDLNDMIETGKVLAEDLLPALASGLKKVYDLDGKPIEGTVSAWNRMKNAMTDTFTYIGESGGAMEALNFIVEAATKVIRGFTAAVQGSWERAVNQAVGKVHRENAQAQTAQSTKHEVEIKLPGGKSGNFEMGSAEDASGLTALLRQLQDAQSRSRLI